MNALRFVVPLALAAPLTACSAQNAVSSAAFAVPAGAVVPAGVTSIAPRLRVDALAARVLNNATLSGSVRPLRKTAPFRDDGPGNHLWISDERGAIWETKATKYPSGTGKTIVGGLFDCAEPMGLKVDNAGNLWAACLRSGTVNMYAPGAKKATRVLRISRTEGANQIVAYPDDVAFDRAGNVFVANAYTLAASSTGGSVNADVDVFLAKASCGNLPCNNATPDLDLVNPHANAPCTVPNCSVGVGLSFIDTDWNGNVYQSFVDGILSCTSSCTVVSSTIGVDAIRRPLSAKPAYAKLVRHMKEPGGVYVTGFGSVVNVLDSGTGRIARYVLYPFKRDGALGPTPQDPHFGDCNPIGIGFNASETLVAAADGVCHDTAVGAVPTNHFIAHANVNYGQLAGAAFSPSDKPPYEWTGQ